MLFGVNGVLVVSAEETSHIPAIHEALSCKKNISAIVCTIMVSLVAAAIPLHARATRRLSWLVASACQALVATTRMPKKIATGRRPNMLERGTMKTFAKPSVNTLVPVSKESCCWLKWNSWPSRGNSGARDSALHTNTQTYNSCEPAVINFHVIPQLRGSLSSQEG